MSTHTGLTIETEQGPVAVPREIEAQGMAAVEAYVAETLAAKAVVKKQTKTSNPES